MTLLMTGFEGCEPRSGVFVNIGYIIFPYIMSLWQPFINASGAQLHLAILWLLTCWSDLNEYIISVFCGILEVFHSS